MKQSDCDMLVSIIVPAFNAETTITECLQSLVQQRHRPLEIVVVDDGSTDGTRDRLDGFRTTLPTDHGLTLTIEARSNAGAPAARNRGASLANGTFIGFLDADDVYHPDKVGLQVAALNANPDWAFCYGPVAALEAPNAVSYGHADVDWRAAILRQLAWPFFATPGPLFRRGFYDRTGGWDETLPACQDWELHSRMMRFEPVFGRVAGAKACFRRAATSDSRVSVASYKARRSNRRALQARHAQLHSAIRNTPPHFRQSPTFQRTAAWELVRLARTQANTGLIEQARENLAYATAIGANTPAGWVCSPAARIGFPSAAGMISTVEWLVYKGLAARNRLGWA